MCDNANRLSSQRIRRLAIAIVASGVISAPFANAGFANNIVLVPPADLPELARQTGEAMFLHDSNDGRALLYIERNQGTRLAILDVTEPNHVKSEGSVQLDAPDTFDFVSNLGNRAILVQFRHGHGNAVLDLHNARLPARAKLPSGRRTKCRKQWYWRCCSRAARRRRSQYRSLGNTGRSWCPSSSTTELR